MKTGIYWQDPEYRLKGMDFIFDPSLVLYLPLYKLDGASFMSKDKHGHLCTVTGALWMPRGRSFDGSDDYIDCGNKESLKVAADITLEVWLKWTSGNAFLIGKGITHDFHHMWFIYIDASGTIAFYGANSTENGYGFSVATTDALIADKWEHILGLILGTTASVYINGQFSKSGSVTSRLSNDEKLFIGKMNGATSPLNGSVSEVRIYHRALTPLEIQHNYLATKWRYQ